MHLALIRDSAHTDATLGTLTIGSLVLQTLELPWVPIDGALCGHPDDSCVPAGDYDLELHDSVAHPKTWALVNKNLGVYHMPADVPPGCVARTAVLLHSGNTAADSRGCLLFGRKRDFPGGESMILDSRVAIDAFKALVPWIEGHVLTIVDETNPLALAA